MEIIIFLAIIFLQFFFQFFRSLVKKGRFKGTKFAALFEKDAMERKKGGGETDIKNRFSHSKKASATPIF